MTSFEDAQKVASASREILHELENPSLDPSVASSCLAYLSRFAQFAQDGPAAVRYATRALDLFHESPRQPLMEEGTFLAFVANAHYLNAQNQLADRYYTQATKKFAQAGRENSSTANVALNNWGLVALNAGVPRRALELHERALRFFTQKDRDANPPPSIVLSRARSLEYIGRISEAQSGYQLAARLSHDSKLVAVEVASLIALASVAEQLGDRTAAQDDLDHADRLMGGSWSADIRALSRRLVLEGKFALADGKLEAARAKFEAVLALQGVEVTKVGAMLGKAETLRLAGAAAAAVTESRAALALAKSLQDGTPYSNHVGLAWLMLGRALEASGDHGEARKAFEAAVSHLSNTVDADQPDLVAARQLFAAAGAEIHQ